MNLIKNQEMKDKFLQKFVNEGKSVQTIAEELHIDCEQAFDLREEFDIDIIDFKAKEYDKIVQEYGLSHINQFNYLAELYKKLKNELDKRDFTGLPTDKLYAILMDVTENINSIIGSAHEHGDTDDDYFDDFEHDHDDY